MLQQPRLFQLVKWGPVQPVSRYFALYLVEQILGRPLNEHTETRLSGCSTVEEIITRISQDDIDQFLFFHTEYGRAKLGEFYVALRTEKRLASINRKWYDVYGVSEHHEELKVEKIQVKTSFATHHWKFDITNDQQEIGYDVLVCIGFVVGLNPLDAKLFVIPADVTRDLAESEIKRGVKGRIAIQIAKQRNFRGTSKLNTWYEYQLLDHTKLKQKVSEYIHGEFIVIFDLKVT
jgi:hypothetical protein